MTIKTQKTATDPKATEASKAVKAPEYTLFLDFGNHDIKFAYGHLDTLEAIRSQVYAMPAGIQAQKASADSPIITWQGTRYHYGYRAKNYRRSEATVNGDKSSLILPAIFATLPPMDGNLTYDLHVVTASPDPRRAGDRIKQALMGTHEYQWSQAEMTVNIKSVEVLPEGLGAYLYAKHQNLVPVQGYTVVIDIGGGTWISHLVNAQGDIISSTPVDRGGSIDLAQSIAEDLRLRDALNNEPLPSVIQDGLADGSNSYGATGASWSTWYRDDHLKPWFRSIIGRVKTQYAAHFSEVTRYLVTGGSSLMVTELLAGSPMFATVPNPRFANVLGMKLHRGA
jgi:Actin like proteins N terminal domain